MTASIVLFDTEYTAWEGSAARKWSEPWEHREIIQLAAIRVTLEDGLSELASFDRLVKPALNPILSEYITALTGIDQLAIDAHGVPFRQAFEGFYAFCESGRVPCFCWANDPAVLRENFALNRMPDVEFPAGIYDIRALFESAGIDTRRYTSGTVHEAVDAPFEHAAHNALNDVRSMAVTIRCLRQAGRAGDDWLGIAMRARF
jgi:inhibitor of KinA sporulation pathway (predicted exonuclease)